MPHRPPHAAHLGQPFTVELTCIDDPTLSGRAEGFMVEAAKTRAVSAEDLVEHVGRMGSSPFEAVSFDIQLDEDPRRFSGRPGRARGPHGLFAI